LYQEIKKIKNRRYTYRFVFVPETIGAICYLSANGQWMKEKTDAGFVLTCCGDNGPFHYKQSRRATSLADRAAEHFIKHFSKEGKIRPFRIDGSDERQYCSPGFNLPVGSLMRTPYYEFEYYHTSFDNNDFISFHALEQTIAAYTTIIEIIELNRTFTNQLMYCEPQLGKRGLYPSSLTHNSPRDFIDRMLHLMNYADGSKDLLEIASLFNTDILSFREAVEAATKHDLIR
jgi:aminopeptidase-like protein